MLIVILLLVVLLGVTTLISIEIIKERFNTSSLND